MNVIFLSIGGLTDLGENAVYPDLLRYFRDNGHSVHVVCQRERRSGLATEMKIEHGIKVLRVQTGNITKTNIIEKGISTILIGSQFKKAIEKFFKDIKFDLVLYSTPPITIANTVSYLKKRDNSFSYLMLKDIFPQNALDIGMLQETGWKGVLTRYFFMKEKKLYQVSDFIGCMSEANVKFLLSNNDYINRKKVEVCPNTINPLDCSENINKSKLRDKFKLPQDKMIFVYGGNFGKPQDVEYIINVLNSNSGNTNLHFVMCGSGTDFCKIKDYAQNVNKSHVTIIDSLCKDDYGKLLNACDVGLIFLDHRFTIPNFPSRLLDYMNHRMPIFAATDRNTDVRDVILNGEFGWWCESNDVKGYQTMIDKITSNPELAQKKGELAREYLEKNFDTRISYERIINAYEKRDKLED
ncbi:glycosyltransferase family 4 protein [Bacillus sp. FJAT-27986]|uniref:glycosyltransferase family 4 protein n=1 Tax=Bacillus sp. FJAT-27986 TaxID=1743146 RepID=UPI00080AD725|nr:glycosyltransferase family 4 protein [Bacillus sp. FJAT-27986]OCA84605.1 glycosyltransferase WbuB [Bacillus sp. FJAT-27986]